MMSLFFFILWVIHIGGLFFNDNFGRNMHHELCLIDSRTRTQLHGTQLFPVQHETSEKTKKKTEKERYIIKHTSKWKYVESESRERPFCLIFVDLSSFSSRRDLF